MKAASSTLNDRTGKRRIALILALVTVISVGVYLIASAVFYQIGFPLDDSWIHQTFARNLALRGEWAFFSGHSSSASTAPLWSALLAIGYWLKLAPYAWAYLLGAAALWGLAVLGEQAIRDWVPSYRPRFPWVGTALALEWHLVWAAASGMETVLFTFLVTAVLVQVVSGSQKYFCLGLLIGLSTWVRPEGITLLVPALLTLFLNRNSWQKRLRSLTGLGLGFGSLFAFYLLFNLAISGSPWPSTFYAKQAEYTSALQAPFFIRLGRQVLQPLAGMGLVLLPGVIIMLVSAVRRRNWGTWAAIAWFAGLLVLYAWRLPVTYQHGRYAMPAMPIFFLLGLAGLASFCSGDGARLWQLTRLFWMMAAAAVLIVFWGLNAFTYASDVALIDSEMVATARWVAKNVPPEALIATHDIGAMGYFGNHELVDMAGLVSPEVVPFIRDESQLAAYLDQRRVSYIVTFPDWYPSLTSGLQPLFTTGAPFAPALGGSNMAVYHWPGP